MFEYEEISRQKNNRLRRRRDRRRRRRRRRIKLPITGVSIFIHNKLKETQLDP